MRIVRIVRGALIATGAATLVLVAWLLAGGPILLDRYLVVNDAPIKANAIICLGSGFNAHDIPVDDGWQRIYTAVQLHYDGFAPVVVFSGGGAAKVTEAEVYSEAAAYLGLPSGVAVLDPVPGGTNEHPANALKIPGLGLTKDSPVIVVTSRLHSKRAFLCFKKAGFTNVRVVSSYVARGPAGGKADAKIVRDTRTSAIESFTPNGKHYDDPLNRLRWGLNDLLMSLRELTAIAVYKVKGYA